MNRLKFLDVLRRFHDRASSDSELTREVRAGIVSYGSATEDNEACASALEVGPVNTSWGATLRGIKLRGKNLLVSEILHELEEHMPESARQAFPDLSEAEWSAAIRVAILTFTALEDPVDVPESD